MINRENAALSIFPFLSPKPKKTRKKGLKRLWACKVTAAVFPEKLHIFFSFSLVPRASANPYQIQMQNYKRKRSGISFY
jgi:hypothetical protein